MSSRKKRSIGKQRRREEVAEEDDGPDIVFEDQFEDEEGDDSDGVVVDAADEDASAAGVMAMAMGGGAAGGGGMVMGEDDEEGEGKEGAEGPTRVFRPGFDAVGDGEVLDYDSSAYKLYHAMNVEWPCLSFDVIRDRLGQNRTKFPMSMYMVAGTQSGQPGKDKLMVMKVSDLHRTENDNKDLSDDDDDDDDDLDDDPILEHRSVKHKGGVNRVRSMPQHSNIVASWADTSHVHVYDVSSELQAVDGPADGGAGGAGGAGGKAGGAADGPLFTFKGHVDEGFAMDWSPVEMGRLVYTGRAGGD